MLKIFSNAHVFFVVLLFMFSCGQSNVQETSEKPVLDTSFKDSLFRSGTEQSVAHVPDNIKYLLGKVQKHFPVYEREAYSDESYSEEAMPIATPVDSFKFYLRKLFNTPGLKKEYIDGADIKVSDDMQFGVVNIFENTGGSFQSYTTYTFYKIKDSIYIDEKDATIGVHSIYTLGKDHYLLFAEGTGCNTCGVDIVTEVEIKGNELVELYSYRADYRFGNLEEFSYDTLTRVFKYDYVKLYCGEGVFEEDGGECQMSGQHKFK